MAMWRPAFFFSALEARHLTIRGSLGGRLAGDRLHPDMVSLGGCPSTIATTWHLQGASGRHIVIDHRVCTMFAVLGFPMLLASLQPIALQSCFGIDYAGTYLGKCSPP